MIRIEGSDRRGRRESTDGVCRWLRGWPLRLALVLFLLAASPGRAQVIELEKSRYQVVEGENLEICMVRSGDLSQWLRAEASSFDGSATSTGDDRDFRPFRGAPYFIEPGAGRRCEVLSTLADHEAEGEETFEIKIDRIVYPSSASIGPRSSATVTILDRVETTTYVSFAETYPPQPEFESGLPFVVVTDFSGLDARPVDFHLELALSQPATRAETVDLVFPEGVLDPSRRKIRFQMGGGFALWYSGWIPAGRLAPSRPVFLDRPSAGLTLRDPSRIEIRLLRCQRRFFGAVVPCEEDDRESGGLQCARSFLDFMNKLLARAGNRAAPAESSSRSLLGSEAGRTADSTHLEPITVLRHFRELRMSSSPAGRYYRSLYESLSRELIETFASRPSLVKAIVDAEPPWIALLDAANRGAGGQAEIRQEMVDSMLAIFDRFEHAGNPVLERVFAFERQRLRLEDLPGMTIEQAIDVIAERGGPPACSDSETSLCLAGGRFLVDVAWRDFAGNTGEGRARPLSGDSGSFWFFDEENLELVVKVLDARSINDRFWVFYGALSNVEYTLRVVDTETGAIRVYRNPAGAFGSHGDTNAFAPDGSPTAPNEASPFSPRRLYGHLAEAGRAALGRSWRRFRQTLDADSLPASSRAVELVTGSVPRPSVSTTASKCAASPTALCLNRGRFRVEVRWRDFRGGSGSGQAAPITGDTGTFWFFDPHNTELIVKVLDGRSINGRFWVFYGALSNVAFTIEVTDTLTGESRRYENPLRTFASRGDTDAF